MDDAQLAQRFAVIERQLARVSQQLRIDCPQFVGAALTGGLAPSDDLAQTSPLLSSTPPTLPDEVVALARAGHHTQAVSLLRGLTGASLLEAKRAVDAL